jgi:SulP family sulfate permease
MEARVWDSSALEAVSDVSARFEAAGKRAHLRHLSPDCARLLEQADDLVEIDTLEDPTYGVATDYPKSAIQ